MSFIMRGSARGAPPELVAMLQDGTADWTAEGFRRLVADCTVPPEYVEIAVRHLGQAPRLIAVQKPEFLAACQVARPDLHPLLLTREGDAWIEAASAGLARGLLHAGLRWFGIG